MAADRQALIQQIEALYAELESVVTGLTEAQLYWQPGGEAWTIMQVLAHVGEFPTFFIRELVRVKADPRVQWGRTMADEGRLRAVAEGAEMPLDVARAKIQAARREVLDTLRSIADGDLAIEAEHVNPKFGRRSMAWLVEHFIIEHIAKHIGQIRRNLRQMAEAAAP